MKRRSKVYAMIFSAFLMVGCDDVPIFLKSDEALKLERLKAENENLRLKNEQLKLQLEANKTIEKQKIQADEICYKDAKKTNTRASYESYVNKYPSGLHAIEADGKINELLEKEQIEQSRKNSELQAQNQEKMSQEIAKLVKSTLTCESRYTKISEVNVSNIKSIDENGTYMVDGEYSFSGRATLNLETTGSYKAKITQEQKLVELWWQDVSRSAYAKEICLK